MVKDKKTIKSEREKSENIENVVVELAKRGNTPAKIGLLLKEKYNVDKFRALGKRITQILRENKVPYKTDLDFVNKKIDRITKHYEDNKQDKRAKREIVRFIGLRKKMERYNSKRPTYQ